MTNGEKILNTFPNVTTRIFKNKDLIYIEVEQNDKWIADFNKEWWNLEYKEPITKNKVLDKKGVLEQLAEQQNNLLAANKAWSKYIEKNEYVD